MAAPHRTGRLQRGDVSIHTRRLGRPGRTPVGFVHGLSSFSHDRLDAAQALGDERECVRSKMFSPETVAKLSAAILPSRVLEVDASRDVARENPREFLGAVRLFLANLEVKSHERAA